MLKINTSKKASETSSVLNSYQNNFHISTMHSDVIQSFINPTNAQLICYKILKFTLKYTTNAPTCFGLTKPSSGSLQSVLR
jgi:hypothetical protein